jgi:hypothetical protein
LSFLSHKGTRKKKRQHKKHINYVEFRPKKKNRKKDNETNDAKMCFAFKNNTFEDDKEGERVDE